MKVTLPLPPNMTNGRFHWRVKNHKRVAYFDACSMIAFDRHNAWWVEEWRDGAPAKAKVKATIYCGGRMDDDNAIARLKWPIDWLVENGWLVGDKPSQLSWHWPIAQVIGRKHQYRVEFELEPA